jgi:hypothetical protein
VFRIYAFRRLRFNLIFNFIGILVLSGFLPDVLQAATFRDVGTLPPKQLYTEAKTSPHSVEVAYSLLSTLPEYQMPISTLSGGEILLLSILIPPGTVYASLNAESNFWQGALMNIFNEEPTQFCGDNNSCQGIHTSDLRSATGGFSATLYGSLGQSNLSSLSNPSYRYFVLYQRSGYGNFVFSSLTFRFKITDIEKYNDWLKDKYTLRVTPAINGTITITPPGFQCNNATDTVNCNPTYNRTDNTQVTLTAVAQSGFRFVNWSNGCSGTNNVTSLLMNSDKTCSATFEKIPENPPEIELFDGAIHLSDGSQVPIQFGSTEEGNPLTKTFTIQNNGSGNLNVTTVTFPVGFSFLESSNLPPLTIPPNTSTEIKIKLDAIVPGTYSGNLTITNNDADENPFDLVINGTVVEFDKFNLNEGKLEFGNEGTSISFEPVKIVVTANVENEDGIIFEPVTQENKETKLKITSDRSVDINAIVTPDLNHPIIDIVVVAGWDDNQGSIHWYQKTKIQDMFDNKTGWIGWIPDMSKLQVTPYVTYENVKESYSVNVFTGRLVPPTDFSQAKQVHFYAGYGFYDSNNNKFVYVVSQPLTFQLPVAQ